MREQHNTPPSAIRTTATHTGGTLEERAADRYRAAHPDIAHLWDQDTCAWIAGRTTDGHGIAVMPLLYTAAVIVTRAGSMTYEDRWCYTDVPAALRAAQAWRGDWPATEPDGWHRHPSTGRRRHHGDPASEHIEH